MSVKVFRDIDMTARPIVKVLSPSILRTTMGIRIIKESKARARIGTLCRVHSQLWSKVIYAVKFETDVQCPISYKTVRYINSYKIVKYVDSEPSSKIENEIMKMVECIDVIAEASS